MVLNILGIIEHFENLMKAMDALPWRDPYAHSCANICLEFWDPHEAIFGGL